VRAGNVSLEGLHLSRRASMLPVPRTAGHLHLRVCGEGFGGGGKRPGRDGGRSWHLVAVAVRVHNRLPAALSSCKASLLASSVPSSPSRY